MAHVFTLTAQTLDGRVVDDSGRPMEFATVSLRTLPDSAIVTGVITGLDGEFSIDHSDGRGDFVQVSTIGYVTCNVPVSAFATPQTISISADNRMRDGGAGRTVRPTATLRGAAVVPTVAGSVLAHSGNSLDVLAKVPGIISADGSLEVVGRGKPLYYINGRRVTDETELRNLMSEDIRSVEVVSNPGAEYGGEVRCVVRIRTVRRQGEGFGFALTSMATQHVYDNHDTEPSWTVLDLNYRNRGLDFIGKVVYFNQRSYQVSDLYGGTVVKTADGHIKTNAQQGYLDYRGHATGWQYDGAVNWQISESHSAGAKVGYAGNSSNDADMIFECDILTDGQKTDHLYSVNDTRSPKGYTVNGNVYYDGTVSDLNINFNADFQQAAYERETTVAETATADPADIRTAADGVSKMGAAKLVASYPIGKGRAKIGAEETYVSGEENYFITLDKLPSSEAELTENNISGFAEYAVMLPVGSLTAGIRFEHVRFDYENRTDASKNVSRVRNNWFPTFNFQTKIKDVGLSLAYSTTIKRPRYHEMTTEITYDNRYAYQTGDPTLLNEIQRTLSLNLQWQWLAASASFESVENTIFQRGYPYDDDGVAMIQYSNADDDARYFNAYLTASPTFGIWNPRYTAGLRMQHFATTVTDPREKAGERELALDDPTAFVYANNAFRLKNKWVVDVDYNFTSRGDVLVSSQTRNKHCLSLAVSKTWLANDALHIRLSLYDVLNKTLSRYSTDYGNCLIEQTNNHYRPTIQLLASFRFNTANSKYKGTGAGQDAKSRM